MEKISPKIVKDIKKSQFQSRSRNFCQFLQGFGISFGEFGLGKKVSFLILENVVSEKKSRFRRIWFQKKYRFRKTWSGKKVSVSFSENLISEKSLGIFDYGGDKIVKKICFTNSRR